MSEIKMFPQVIVNTNEQKRPLETVSRTGVGLFAPILSDKGEANIIKKINSLGEFLNEYGAPNFRKHGQQNLNVANWLANDGVAYVVRMLPKNNTKGTVSLNYSDGELYSTYNFNDSFNSTELLSFTNLKSGDSVEKEISIKYNSVESENYGEPIYGVSIYEKSKGVRSVRLEGPFTVSFEDTIGRNGRSIFVEDVINRHSQLVRCKFNSNYYENLADKEIFKDPTLKDIEIDNVIKHLNQAFSILNLDEDVVADSTLETDTGTLTLFESIQLDIGDVDNTEFNYQIAAGDELTSLKQISNIMLLQAVSKQDVKTDMFKEYADVKSNTTAGIVSFGSALKEPEKDDFDLEHITNEYKKIVSAIIDDNVNTKSSSFDDGEVILTLNNNFNGFDFKFGQIKDVFNTNEDLVLDREILNKNSYDIDVILDAAYPNEVKDIISDFVSKTRDDIMFFRDFGDFKAGKFGVKSIAEVLQRPIVDSPNVALYPQYGVVEDIYSTTNRDIMVTPTYFLADLISGNDSVFGPQVSLAGTRYGIIRSLKSISFNPNDSNKATMYATRCNYIEVNPREAILNTELTSQETMGPLSYISNQRVLQLIRRRVKSIGRKYIHQFNNDTTVNNLEKEISEYMDRWIENGALERYGVEVYASDYDRDNNIIRIRLNIEFTGIVKVVIADLMVE